MCGLFLLELPSYGIDCAIAPIVGAALIAGAASILSAIGGAVSNSNTNSSNEKINADTNATNAANVKATNDANIQIASQTNAVNKQLQESQNAWNLQQWNRENQYNSPASQVARLRDAGINPAAVFGNGSVSEASQLTSAPFSPAVAPQLQAFQSEPYYENPAVSANIISNSLSGFAQARLANAQAEKTANDVSIANAQNVREAEKHLSMLTYWKNKAVGSGIENEMAREMLDLSRATMQSKVAAAMNDVRLQEQAFKESNLRQANLDVQNKLANIELQFSPLMKGAELQHLRAGLQQIGAQIKLINAQTALTDEQKASEVQKRVGMILDYDLKDFDLRVKKAIEHYVVDSAKYASVNEQKKAKTFKLGPLEYSPSWHDNASDVIIPWR